MKKFISALLLALFVFTPCANAMQSTDVVAPKWEDYIPTKYQHPRNDFTRGGSIAELVTGIILTDLILTSPIGIPMICHSTTKLKNLGYYEKKIKFNNGLANAETITDPAQKQAYYNRLLTDCKMTDVMKAKQAKRVAKEQKKAAKKNK